MTIRLHQHKTANTATIHPIKVSCGQCRIRHMCLPAMLVTDEVGQLDDIIERKATLQRNEYLFRKGDTLDSLYIVRTGALKASKTTTDGKLQVTGFYFPGQMLGLEGICNLAHSSSAIALETSAICHIPYAALQSLSAAVPNLLLNTLRALSREIVMSQQLITLLGNCSAEERVAGLLLRLVQHNIDLGLSDSRIRLPMSRRDIADHLGLTIETVSRTFTHMRNLNILDVKKREIVILKPQLLLEHSRLAEKVMSPAEDPGTLDSLQVMA
jgi:CRP/FNR family transcriptional regulator